MKPGADIERRSLYERSAEEARNFRLFKSIQEGHDVGNEACQQWNREYWWEWVRQRWKEHLAGKVYWIEFGDDDFGLIREITPKIPDFPPPEDED